MKALLVNEALTGVAQEYSNAELIGRQVAPRAETTKSVFTYPIFGKEAFRIVDTAKAPGTATPKMNLALTKESGSLEPHALAIPVNWKEEPDDEVGLRLRAPRTALDVINLRLEQAVASIVFALSSYPSTQRTTLSGTGQWSHASSSPITVITAAKSTVAAAIGRDPNTLVLGRPVFDALIVHAEIRAQLATTGIKVVTAEVLAQVLGVKRVLVGNAIKSDAAGTMSRIWGKFAALLYVPEAVDSKAVRSMYEPAFAYTFEQKGHPMVDQWDDSDAESTFYRTANHYLVKVVGSSAGYLWAEAVA